MTASNESELVEGLVVFRSSREIKARVGEDELLCELRGALRQRKETVVVGDVVRILPGGAGRGVVEEVLPRSNFLARRREVGGGRQLIVAANLDQVLPVFALRQPKLKFGALDRLLVAASHRDLPVVIVVNKIDLGPAPDVESELLVYEEIGYRVIRTSIESELGLEQLHAVVSGRVSVVSGPSGVGKSSLLSRVLGVPIRVGEVSRHNEKGKHTTTAATGYGLPGGGAVIDTPGFRDYGLWDMEPASLAHCMPDLAEHAQHCHFANCLHRGEPKCRVESAAEEGAIRTRRLRSYRGILDTLLEQQSGK